MDALVTTELETRQDINYAIDLLLQSWFCCNGCMLKKLSSRITKNSLGLAMFECLTAKTEQIVEFNCIILIYPINCDGIVAYIE